MIEGEIIKIIVKSVAILTVVGGGVYLGYRMGQEEQNELWQETLRSIPEGAIDITKSESKYTGKNGTVVSGENLAELIHLLSPSSSIKAQFSITELQKVASMLGVVLPQNIENMHIQAPTTK